VFENREVKNERNVEMINKFKRYMDVETLIDEIVKQGPNTDSLRELLEYMGRQYDLPSDMRQRIDDYSGRSELQEIVEDMKRMWQSPERFLKDAVMAMSAEEFEMIASETARLYDLPSEIRDELR
jgi:hypothetical protein